MTKERITSATLSHGVAKYYSDKVAEKNTPETLLKIYKLARTRSATVKKIQEAIKGELKHTVIIEKIYKEKGSRAKATWVILVALADQAWAMVVINLNKGQIHIDLTPVYVSGHTLARMIQRTTHEMDIKPIIALLTPHLLAMHAQLVMAKEEIPEGTIYITTYHHLGKVMWIWDGESRILAKTWVDASLFHLEDLAYIEQLSEGGTLLVIDGCNKCYEIEKKVLDELIS